MIIAIGADHRGFVLKASLMKNLGLQKFNIIWKDVGCADEIERYDYPEYAIAVCKEIRAGRADLGILLCGSGVGMAITANRFRDIYASVVWDVTIAEQSRAHDKSNVLVLPADYITEQQAVAFVIGWLGATFLGGRYQERITMIDQLGGI